MVSVIIKPGKYISGGETVFNYGLKHTDLGKSAHVQKHLHFRIITGPFKICFHEGSLWRGHRVLIYFIITFCFVHLIRNGDRFYNWYINSKIRTKYLDDDGTGVKPKHFSQNNEQEKCVDIKVIIKIQEGNVGQRYEKIKTKFGKKNKINWIYLSSWILIPWGWRPFESEVVFTWCYY